MINQGHRLNFTSDSILQKDKNKFQKKKSEGSWVLLTVAAD